MKATNVRLLISCLALAVAMVVMAAPAYAGGVAFQASSLPVQVRGEGLTETVGAVVLQATGPGSITSGSSITFVFSGAITNASSFTAGGNAGVSCSGAGIVGAVPPACNTNITSSASNTQLTVSFGGAAGATYAFAQGDSIEINQVRININALGTATTTATATLSGTSSAPTTNPITFTQSQVAVASIVNPSIKASSFTAGTAIQTCATAATTFSLKVTENYPAALTSTADEAGFTPITTVVNGSLVYVTISNLPVGYGVQFSSAVAQTGTIALTPTSASAGGTGTPVVISTGSPIVFIFAATGDSTSVIDSSLLTFNVGYGNSAGTALSGTSAAALGTVVTATATVSLGPSSGIVSFATNNEGSGTIVTLGDCVTNLLFPFTTNQVGFDTNIQISNTSADKLAFPTGGATAQTGTCTLTYYPTDLTTQTTSAAGNAGTPSQFTTPSVPAGGAYAFAQSTSTFKGQSGYMFAVCRFLDAHGFSFVVNGTPSTGTISQGLLALVIPNTSIATGRLANPSGATGGVVIAGGTYEGLVH